MSDGELPCTTIQNSEIDTVGYLITFGTSGKEGRELLLVFRSEHNGLRTRPVRTQKLWAKS